MEIESSWLEGFYSHYLSRDFTYLIAGGLFVCVSEYALWGKIILPQQLSLELIGFLIIFYIVGVAIYEIGSTKIISFKKLSPPLPVNYSCRLVLLQDLIENYDKRVLNQYERFVYLSIFGTSVGSSSIGGGVLMVGSALFHYFSEKILPSVNNAVLTFILFIFGIYMLYIGKKYFGLWHQEQQHLINGIEFRNKRKGTNV